MMKHTENYNTDLYRWENERQSALERPYGGCIYCISDGMVHNGYVILARFSDTISARKILKAAGFHEIKKDKFKA